MDFFHDYFCFITLTEHVMPTTPEILRVLSVSLQRLSLRQSVNGESHRDKLSAHAEPLSGLSVLAQEAKEQGIHRKAGHCLRPSEDRETRRARADPWPVLGESGQWDKEDQRSLDRAQARGPAGHESVRGHLKV